MFTVHHSHSATLPRSASRPSLMTRILCAVSLQHQRSKLAKLDDALLSDIGVTRAEAMTEAARPFWDAPDHWQR